MFYILGLNKTASTIDGVVDDSRWSIISSIDCENGNYLKYSNIIHTGLKSLRVEIKRVLYPHVCLFFFNWQTFFYVFYLQKTFNVTQDKPKILIPVR